jgi:hypothetical protein
MSLQPNPYHPPDKDTKAPAATGVRMGVYPKARGVVVFVFSMMALSVIAVLLDPAFSDFGLPWLATAKDLLLCYGFPTAILAIDILRYRTTQSLKQTNQIPRT